MIKSNKVPNLRDEIIRISWDFFNKEGLEGLSFREVARHLGVSHNTPYRHFLHKKDLLLSLAEKGFRMLLEAMRHQAAGIDARTKLINAGVAYTNFFHKHPNIIELMFGEIIKLEDSSPELLHAALLSFAELEKIISDGVQSGEFQTNNIRETSLAAWALVHGLATLLSSERFSFLSQEISDDPACITRKLCTHFAASISKN